MRRDPARTVLRLAASFAVMMVLMFGIMYFMLIRPQQQQRKKLEGS